MRNLKRLLATGAVLGATMMASSAFAAGQPQPVNPTKPLPSSFNGNATIYNTASAFAANAGAVVTQDFEFTPTNTTVPSQGFASGQFTDANGTTFALATLPTSTNGVVDLNLLDSTYLPSTGSYIGTHYGSDVLGSNYSDIRISFDHAITAFGLNFGSFGRGFTDLSDIFAFTVAGLGTQTAFSNAGGPAFFGFTSATPFTSILISTTDSTQRVYDKVSISAPAAAGAVPEPATWGMMLLGFGAVGFAMRRRGVATRISTAG